MSVFVATPTKLSNEQKGLLRELYKTLGMEPIPQEDRGFFDKVKDAFGL